MLLSVLLIASLLLFGVLGVSTFAEEDYSREKDHLDERSFYMGFTPWPPDLTVKDLEDTYQFIRENGDIISHHLDNGIPWDEALEGKSFSKHLQETWAYRKTNTPKGHKIYLAITPLNFERNNLATYWGKTDNMPLQSPWKGKRLDDDAVKQHI